jgi:sucrose-6-phosphate hydrolase SacC (GH32 family)
MRNALYRPATLLLLVALASVAAAAASARAADAPAAPALDEKHRPQFHFTAPKGWLNDPNGLVFYDGEWHLFYQHNPGGTNWIPELSWGHAVSKDLLHWQHLSDALPPTPRPGATPAGSWSGSGLVDANNTAGFQTGAERPIVLAWTAINMGQCIAFSNDHGRTFKLYDQNPVIGMDPPKRGDWDRDPKVYWHEPTKRWVMAFSISGRGFVFHSSPDLKHWTREGLFADLWECPDYFELLVDGKPDQKKWVIWDASGKYFIGQFDGKNFAKESGPFLLDYGHQYYAAQTWSNAPDARRVGIAWLRDGRFPDMPFNGQMGIPFELALRTLPEGVRLTKVPVKEVEGLRYATKEVKDEPLGRNNNLLADFTGGAIDLEADIEPRSVSEIILKLRGVTIQYVPGLLRCMDQTAPVTLIDGRLKLRVLVDRTSVEVFANDGATSISACYLPTEGNAEKLKPQVYAERGEARIVSLRVHKLHSVWQP